MNKILWAVIFALGFFTIAQAQQPKTILAVFPHPDDESALAEVLLKYAEMGYRIQLIIATDGKDGTRVTKIPAGDSLGTIRKEETRCACKILGIEPPIYLGIDRLDTRIGTGKYFAEHKKFLAALKQKIEELNPAIILTFGPDGDTHHAEHIVTGAAVTELLLREGWVDKYPLYYLAWTKEQGQLFDLGYVHPQYSTVKIEYSQQQEEKALQIMPCYATQYTPEELVEDRKKKLADTNHVIHFRKFGISNDALKNDFFEQGSSYAAAGEKQITEELKAKEYEAIMAEFRLDTAFIATLMEEDFISIYPNKIQNKQQELAGMYKGIVAMKKEQRTVDSLYLDDFRVQLFDNTAIATFYTVSRGTKRGKPYKDYRMRWYDVWVKRHGEWKWVSSQGTVVKKR